MHLLIDFERSIQCKRNGEEEEKDISNIYGINIEYDYDMGPHIIWFPFK